MVCSNVNFKILWFFLGFFTLVFSVNSLASFGKCRKAFRKHPGRAAVKQGLAEMTRNITVNQHKSTLIFSDVFQQIDKIYHLEADRPLFSEVIRHLNMIPNDEIANIDSFLLSDFFSMLVKIQKREFTKKKSTIHDSFMDWIQKVVNLREEIQPSSQKMIAAIVGFYFKNPSRAIPRFFLIFDILNSPFKILVHEVRHMLETLIAKDLQTLYRHQKSTSLIHTLFQIYHKSTNPLTKGLAASMIYPFKGKKAAMYIAQVNFAYLAAEQDRDLKFFLDQKIRPYLNGSYEKKILSFIHESKLWANMDLSESFGSIEKEESVAIHQSFKKAGLQAMERSESISMRKVILYELEMGRFPIDVSARKEVGYDILSVDFENNYLRKIEVKSRHRHENISLEEETISLSTDEIQAATDTLSEKNVSHYIYFLGIHNSLLKVRLDMFKDVAMDYYDQRYIVQGTRMGRRADYSIGALMGFKQKIND